MKTCKEALASFIKAPGFREKAIAAFTLIEILIVVAIIGIILGIAVPALNGAREQAIQTKRDAVISQVATAKARYLLSAAGLNKDNTYNVQFSDIQNYLLVNGGIPADMNALLSGTGWNGANFNIGTPNNVPVGKL